jgi:hypothetical protein
MGIFAVIFGKAYYEGFLKLKDLERFLVKSWRIHRGILQVQEESPTSTTPQPSL